jgi:hypothetical protein
MGAFNRWTNGSFLAQPENRPVVQIARNLMGGAAAVTRAQQLRAFGVVVPSEAFSFQPRPLRRGHSTTQAFRKPRPGRPMPAGQQPRGALPTRHQQRRRSTQYPRQFSGEPAKLPDGLTSTDDHHREVMVREVQPQHPLTGTAAPRRIRQEGPNCLRRSR